MSGQRAMGPSSDLGTIRTTLGVLTERGHRVEAATHGTTKAAIEAPVNAASAGGKRLPRTLLLCAILPGQSSLNVLFAFW